MPEEFDNITTRLEYFLSTFVASTSAPIKLSNGLNVSLSIPVDLIMQLNLNNETFLIPNIPRFLEQLIDVKYDTIQYYGIEYGINSL